MDSLNINKSIMKKILSILILSLIVSCNTAFAVDPDLIINEPLQVELYQPAEEETFQFEPLPLEPIPLIPDDPYTDDPGIDIFLDAEEIEGGRVGLHWNRYEGPNFEYYKILHSTEDNNLFYPETPEIEFYEDPNKTGFIHNEPEVGDNFYRICVTTTDQRRGCSNVQFVFRPEGLAPDEAEFEDPDARPHMEEEPEPRPDRPELTEDQIQKIKDRNNASAQFDILQWLWDNLVIILTIITVIIAATGFTFASKRKQKSISKYMNQIDDTYSEYKMKAKRCEAELYRLKDIVDNELKSGKIDEGAYKLLMNRIEGYMVDIQKQIVNEKFGGLPASLKDEMFKMMEDGEITESEFETMQKLIKRSELSASEQDNLLEQLKDFKKQDEAMKRKD